MAGVRGRTASDLRGARATRERKDAARHAAAQRRLADESKPTQRYHVYYSVIGAPKTAPSRRTVNAKSKEDAAAKVRNDPTRRSSVRIEKVTKARG